jgi:hypothetical protein
MAGRADAFDLNGAWASDADQTAFGRSSSSAKDMR